MTSYIPVYDVIYSNICVIHSPCVTQGEFGEYWLGAGGTCVDRDPPVGYCELQNRIMNGIMPALVLLLFSIFSVENAERMENGP